MSTYSIKDLEKLTGIKAHTIRIWEQRYALFNPGRSETNIRLYGSEDLRLMLKVAILYAGGMRISKIAKMSVDQMCLLIREQCDQSKVPCSRINALIAATIEFNEEDFEKIMSDSIDQAGFEQTISEIIFPFLERIGVLWTTHTICPAQEHFITHLIRQKIIAATDRQFIPKIKREASFLLFLPENEFHEIGLLFGAYLLRSRGFKVWYLGQNMPLSDLQNAFSVRKPTHLFTILTMPDLPKKANDYLLKLSEAFPDSNLWIGGPQAAVVKKSRRFTVFSSVNAFIEQTDKTA